MGLLPLLLEVPLAVDRAGGVLAPGKDDLHRLLQALVLVTDHDQVPRRLLRHARDLDHLEEHLPVALALARAQVEADWLDVVGAVEEARHHDHPAVLAVAGVHVQDVGAGEEVQDFRRDDDSQPTRVGGHFREHRRVRVCTSGEGSRAGKHSSLLQERHLHHAAGEDLSQPLVYR